MITTATNFDAILNAYQSGYKIILLEGASRSGKSWDAAAFILFYLYQKNRKAINICRDYRSILVKTTYQTLKKVWIHYEPLVQQFNKTATPIQYKQNQVNFIGINDNIMAAHGLESDLLWVNEGNSIERESINQLIQRTNDFVIIDYNPSSEQHYLYDFENRDDTVLHKTTIFDNPYAPKAAKDQILSYAHPKVNDFDIALKAGYTKSHWFLFKNRNVELGTADQYLWEVYGLGLRAAGTDLVFNANRIKTYEDEPERYNYKHYGGDFGFANNPAAYCQVIVDGHNVYIRELIYETGLTNEMLAQKIINLNANDELSVWDSAEPKSIVELRTKGINATKVLDKDVTFGIKRLQKYNIFIHKDSKNALREFKGYTWKKDKQGRYVTNSKSERVPTKKDDHLIDAVRYVVTRYLE